MVKRFFIILIPVMAFLSVQVDAMNITRRRVPACEECYRSHKRCSTKKPCKNCTTHKIDCVTITKKTPGRKKRNAPVTNMPVIRLDDDNEQTVSSPGAITEDECASPKECEPKTEKLAVRDLMFVESSEAHTAELLSHCEDLSRMRSLDFPFIYKQPIEQQKPIEDEELFDDDSWKDFLNDDYFIDQ